MATNANKPTFFELARQGLSSTRVGYDLLSPKFETTPFATQHHYIDRCLEAVLERYPLPEGETILGSDLACGTGRGVRALRRYCDLVDGYDFSRGMLDEGARLSQGLDGLEWIESDLSTDELPRDRYHLVTMFGAWGHILPAFRDHVLTEILASLRPQGVFATITVDEPKVTERRFWYRLGFDLGVKLRNLLWPDEFHMYYRLNSTSSLTTCFQNDQWDQGCYELALQRLVDDEVKVLTILTVRRL